MDRAHTSGPEAIETLRQELHDQSFVVVEDVVDARGLDELRNEADAVAACDQNRGGARNLLQKSTRLRELAADGPVIQLARSAEPARRRVLHFEYSSEDLPGGLEWVVRP